MSISCHDTIKQVMNTETCLCCSDSILDNHVISRIIRCPKCGHHHKQTNLVIFNTWSSLTLLYHLLSENSKGLMKCVQRTSCHDQVCFVVEHPFPWTAIYSLSKPMFSWYPVMVTLCLHKPTTEIVYVVVKN